MNCVWLWTFLCIVLVIISSFIVFLLSISFSYSSSSINAPFELSYDYQTHSVCYCGYFVELKCSLSIFFGFFCAIDVIVLTSNYVSSLIPKTHLSLLKLVWDLEFRHQVSIMLLLPTYSSSQVTSISNLINRHWCQVVQKMLVPFIS